MSKFQYGGFVSYRHGDPDDPYDALNSFAKQVKEALASELKTQGKDVYFDLERMKGGFVLNPVLGSSVCKSVCMIVIFVRDYLSLDKPYCAAELWTMLQCEQERFQKLGIDPATAQRGHIVTLAYRNPDLVPDILKKRIFYDFSGHTAADLPLRLNKDYAKVFVEIATYIADLYDEIEHQEAAICKDCDQRTMPDLDDPVANMPVLDFIRQHRKKRAPLMAQF